MILEELFKKITERIKTLPQNSYVANLYRQGENAVVQKVGEEAVEVVVAAKDKDRQRIIEEVADLYFTTLILLAAKGISIDEIYKELGKRSNKMIKSSS